MWVMVCRVDCTPVMRSPELTQRESTFKVQHKSLGKLEQFPGIPWAALTLKVQIMTAADDSHKSFFHRFSDKIRLDVSSVFSARQRIHMKNEALFSLKDKSKKLKCHLLQFLLGALRAKICTYTYLPVV